MSAEDTDAPIASGSASGIVKRTIFRYTKPFILLLLKCVRQFDANHVAYGAKVKAFSKALNDFLGRIPDYIWQGQNRLGIQTLRDKLLSLMMERKTQNKTNEILSGVQEEVSESDQLLDDFLLESKEDEIKIYRDEQSVREKCLT